MPRTETGSNLTIPVTSALSSCGCCSSIGTTRALLSSLTLQGYISRRHCFRSSTLEMMMWWCTLHQLLLLGVFSSSFAEAGSSSGKPHLIVILSDDFGYGNLGYHRADESKEVATPNMDALAAKGVKLERFYTYRFCSPSRCSLQTGRLPVHVNTLNIDPINRNPKDPMSGFAGIPQNMTTVATRLKQAGYKTVGCITHINS